VKAIKSGTLATPYAASRKTLQLNKNNEGFSMTLARFLVFCRKSYGVCTDTGIVDLSSRLRNFVCQESIAA
jgi:hypothetical protein